MLKYVAKRLVYIVFTLWIIVTCTFYMMKNLPGTPFDAERFSIMTPAQKKQVLEMYGLNDPLPVQYVKYMKNIIHGDLGTSFTYVNKDVADVISGRLGPSALIGIQAVLLGLAVGLILGILAAWKHNSGIDYFTMILAVLGVSVPNFVAAALLQYFIGLKWGILPVGFWTNWDCSVLPSIALSFSATAMVARFMRTEMLDVLDQDYIVTARAKGISQMKVLMRHAARNSVLPVVTILGPVVVNLMTGSLTVENIFSIPGIGSLFVDCIKANDYPVIMGITIFYAAFYMLVVLLIDLVYSVIDPRIRLAKGKEDES
ncbi:ABC transporter permease [Blautia pseudococcoides]|uniref:ABC transporter permease n=1 Tax=Blautia pseudococcoides TaxID=1796616 RepID=UPI00148B1B84|nr:ABC transporter permease [Blautia pseudococcoides]QJU15659.1 ABC transporter permease [Blautia pseudococcoides]